MKKAPHLYLTVFFVVYSTLITFAQFSSNDETRLIIVQQEDKNIHADILKEDFLFIPESDITYYCYYQGSISSIQGSYTGLLLTGFYEEFDLEQKLITQGHFYYGMKHGRWKEWHESGKLKKIQIWDKGKMSGAFQEFDEEGEEVKRGNYKNNEIVGKLTILKDGEVKEEKYYKDGEETEKQELSAIFKKKDKKEEGDKQKKNNKAQNPKESKRGKDKKEKAGFFKKDKKKKEDKSPSNNKKSKEARARSTSYVPESVAEKETPVKVNQKPKTPNTAKSNDKYKKYFSRRFPF